MTTTHTTHFGLTVLATTTDRIVLEGTLTDCKRMAFAHGLELGKMEGVITGCNNGFANYAPVNETQPNRIWLKTDKADHAGMIQRTRDAYALVMPLELWNKDV